MNCTRNLLQCKLLIRTVQVKKIINTPNPGCNPSRQTAAAEICAQSHAKQRKWKSTFPSNKLY